MKIFCLIFVLFLASILISSCRSTETSPKPEFNSESGQALFEKMNSGKWSSVSFAMLDWSAIDYLLEKGKSGKKLSSFPRNPFSSQSQRSCSEGMMALWLIEGIRLNIPGGYPSCNPLCFAAGSKDWHKDSEANRERILEAYRTWWEEVRELPVDKRRQKNPLEDTLLHWH